MAASMNSENTVVSKFISLGQFKSDFNFNLFKTKKKKIYQTVIDEVLTNIREAFLDEGYDEQLLQELKQVSRDAEYMHILARSR